MPATTDAKALAAAARSALRAATKTDDDPLHGLAVSVRLERASMCTEIAVTVRGLAEADLVRTEEQQRDGAGCWTDRARVVSDRVHALIPDALAWADGRMRFAFVYFIDGLLAPSPR